MFILMQTLKANLKEQNFSNIFEPVRNFQSPWNPHWVETNQGAVLVEDNQFGHFRLRTFIVFDLPLSSEIAESFLTYN